MRRLLACLAVCVSALAFAPPAMAARPVVQPPGDVMLGRWQGQSGRDTVVFWVEATANHKRWLVRPVVWCSSSQASVWGVIQAPGQSGPNPDAWPISSGGVLRGVPPAANFPHSPWRPPPMVGRFTATTATLTIRENGTPPPINQPPARSCETRGLRVVAHPVPTSPVLRDKIWTVSLAPHVKVSSAFCVGCKDSADLETYGQGALADSSWTVSDGAACFFSDGGLDLLVRPDGSFGAADLRAPFGVDAGITMTLRGRFVSPSEAQGTYTLNGRTTNSVTGAPFPPCSGKAVRFYAHVTPGPWQGPPQLAWGNPSAVLYK